MSLDAVGRDWTPIRLNSLIFLGILDLPERRWTANWRSLIDRIRQDPDQRAAVIQVPLYNVSHLLAA
jgi:hypothetical protein